MSHKEEITAKEITSKDIQVLPGMAPKPAFPYKWVEEGVTSNHETHKPAYNNSITHFLPSHELHFPPNNCNIMSRKILICHVTVE